MTDYVDPTREQFGAMMKAPDDGPIHMLNMLHFRDRAAYPEGHPNAAKGLTGAEAYQRYGAESGPIFHRVGGSIGQVWEPRLTLIGPDDEIWHRVFVAVYPSAAAFGEMLKDPEYQKAVVHRQAAVKTSRLIRMALKAPGDGFAD